MLLIANSTRNNPSAIEKH